MEHTFCLISPLSRSFKLLHLNQHHSLPSSFLNQTLKRTPTISSQNRRNRFISNVWKKKLILGVFDLVSSNLNMFPEPLTLAIRSFIGGGGGGFLKRLGGGGGSDGWRRKGKVNFKLILLVIMGFGCSGLWLIMEKGMETDVVLGFGFLALCLIGVGMRDWIIGLFSFVVLVTMGLGLKKGDLMKWIQGFRLMENTGRSGGRRRRKRAF